MSDASDENNIGADWVAPDCAGLNFFAEDAGLQSGVETYLPEELRKTVLPYMIRLGEVAGGRLDELARIADRHPPVLHTRDPFGRNQETIEYHPAYREIEQLAYGEFSIHRMCHVAGVFGWPEPMPPLVRYIFQYLFVQGEFGLMCPVSMTDTGLTLIRNQDDADLKDAYLPRMLTDNIDELWRCAQFLTEQGAGSDVGNIEVTAKLDGNTWRIHVTSGSARVPTRK